jgi:large subunit ribosomal protein L30
MAKYIQVKQIRSTIGQSKQAKKVLMTGLGLRAIGKQKTFKDSNCIRGMVNKVHHLVAYNLISKKS